MFDASEILFLSRAVELGALTANQKRRLLGFQHDLESGMNVTTLVVEAGLMAEDEVRIVLDAIASGVSSPAALSADGLNTLGEGRETSLSAATRASLDSLLDDAAPPPEGRVGEEVDAEGIKAMASVIRSVLRADGSPPNASDQPQESSPRPSSFQGEGTSAAPPQKFPMPGVSREQAFPMPQSAYPAFPEAPADEFAPFSPAPDAAEAFPPEDNPDAASEPPQTTKARQLAVSLDEVEDVLAGE